MKMFWRCLVVAVLALAIGGAAAAQDNSTPLLEMLASVPDVPNSRSELSFNDRLAIEAAYPPAQKPADFAEFKSLEDTEDDQPQEVWWRVFMNVTSSQSSRYLALADEMPDVVGFDYFDVTREMNYGEPPETTIQLEGEFDVEAIRTALAAQGYERHDEFGAELWCSAEGCDAGDKMDLTASNPANPFGGDLGRRFPILVTENRLIASVSLPVVEAHAQVLSGDAPSLADVPDYRAAAEALTSSGTLIQADFFGGEVLQKITQFSPAFLTRATPEQVKQIVEDMLKDFETLPAYELMAFGDVVTDTQQIGKLALVYSDAEAAKTAADLIPRRIAAYESLTVNRSMTDLLQSRGVGDVTAEVSKSETGQYVVVLSFPTSKATPEEIAAMTPTNTDASEVTPPGAVYRLLVSMVMQADIGWLTTSTREDLEALAGG